MTWIDIGSTTVSADDVKYVRDVQEADGTVFAAGMKSVVTFKSGGWTYARYARAAIIRRVTAALAAQAGGEG